MKNALLFIILVFFVACSTPKATAIPKEMVTIPPTLILTPTFTPTLKPTQKQSPSQTPTPNQTQIAREKLFLSTQ
jgi:hypothetical protein